MKLYKNNTPSKYFLFLAKKNPACGAGCNSRNDILLPSPEGAAETVYFKVSGKDPLREDAAIVALIF